MSDANSNRVILVGPGRRKGTRKGTRNKIGIDRRAGAARLGRNAGPSARRGGLDPIRFDRRI